MLFTVKAYPIIAVVNGRIVRSKVKSSRKKLQLRKLAAARVAALMPKETPLAYAAVY